MFNLMFKKAFNFLYKVYFLSSRYNQEATGYKRCRTCCESRADEATRCARRGRGSAFPSAR